jgi:DNA-binding FadR family transcriptional regulator
MASSIPEHQAIMDAICQGDSDHAADLMSKHVNMLGDNLGDVVNFLERMKADADNKSQSTITYGIVTLPDATQA